MTFEEMLEFVVNHTKHKRYVALCHESTPDWKDLRSHVIDRYYQIKSGPNPEPSPGEPTIPLVPCCDGDAVLPP